MSSIEIWAGVECTVNHVGDSYYDQLHWNGHADRFDGLELFAQLGITILRFPLISMSKPPKRSSRLFG